MCPVCQRKNRCMALTDRPLLAFAAILFAWLLKVDQIEQSARTVGRAASLAGRPSNSASLKQSRKKQATITIKRFVIGSPCPDVGLQKGIAGEDRGARCSLHAEHFATLINAQDVVRGPLPEPSARENAHRHHPGPTLEHESGKPI